MTRITRNGTMVFTYTYNADGEITRRTYPDNTSHTATFNTDGRIASLTSAGHTTTFTYDAAGNLTTTSLPNGTTEVRTTDPAGRTSSVESTNGGATVVRVDQQLDPVGNPTTVTTTRGTTQTTDTYTYDPADRLVGNCIDTTAPCTPAAAKRITYTYDPVGNRLTQDRVGTATTPGTTNYTYNPADQLTETTGPDGTTSYTYDPDGNQTTAGTTNYTYDLNNKLTQATIGTTTTSYTYDGEGKRVTRATNGTLDTRYHWDPTGPLPELALERTGTNTLISRYVQGPTGPISTTTGAGTFFYHRDAIGSIRAVTNASGADQWHYDYDPYGEERATVKVASTAPANLVQYAGEAIDTETGLYHLRARQYNPRNGKFLSVDPDVLRPSRPTFSTYIYADGAPTTMVDPTGYRGVPVAPGYSLTSPCCTAWNLDGRFDLTFRIRFVLQRTVTNRSPMYGAYWVRLSSWHYNGHIALVGNGASGKSGAGARWHIMQLANRSSETFGHQYVRPVGRRGQLFRLEVQLQPEAYYAFGKPRYKFAGRVGVYTHADSGARLIGIEKPDQQGRP